MEELDGLFLAEEEAGKVGSEGLIDIIAVGK